MLVNSQLISNVCTDALSAEKYYYFIRLMGRKTSHVALECTLQSHPNMVILAEEVASLRCSASQEWWKIVDGNPGALQFDGPGADYMGRIKQLQQYLEKVKPGCSQDVLSCLAVDF